MIILKLVATGVLVGVACWNLTQMVGVIFAAARRWSANHERQLVGRATPRRYVASQAALVALACGSELALAGNCVGLTVALWALWRPL